MRALMGLDLRPPDTALDLAVNIDNRQAVIKVVYEEAAVNGDLTESKEASGKLL